MKSIRALSILGLLLSTPAVRADTFILKDGTELEGTVLSEEGENYLLEIQVTKSIKDERVVPKAEVVRIVREKLDETAFEDLTALVPVPDSQAVAEYDRRIAAVDAFLKEFPTTAKLKEAKEMHKALTDERAVVAAGGMKMGGLMISAADYQGNAYDLDARALELRIREHADRSEWLAALRVFSALDAEYRASTSYQAVIPVVVQVLRTFQTEVVGSLATLDDRLKKREAGLTRMAVSDRNNTLAAIKNEEDILEARYQKEKASRIAWVTPSLFHKASLEDCRRLGESELKRLTGPITPGDAGKAYRDAWTTIHSSSDPAAVKEAISQAKTANLSPRYVAMLEAAVKPAAATP
jgi:hypothetical protein